MALFSCPIPKENTMKKTIILSAALLALPAMAQQSASLIFDQVTHNDTTLGAGFDLSTDKTTGFGVRYGFDATHLGATTLTFEATYRPRGSEKDIKQNGVSASSGTTSIKMSEEYLGVGIGARWTQVVDFGATLELRQESMDLDYTTSGSSSTARTATTRPWLGVNVGYTFQAAPVKPFVALSYRFALAKKTSNNSDLAGPLAMLSQADIISRAVLPKSELQLEAGIRF